MGQLGKKLRTLEGGSIGFWCPGCESMHAVRISTPRDNWIFNGNGDAPTFQPSVLVQSNTWVPPVTPENLEKYKNAPWQQRQIATVCHSFVTDGQIQFLNDCTHDLPDFP